MSPPRIWSGAEKLHLLVLSIFAIIATFGDGPRIPMMQSSDNNYARMILVKVGVVLDPDTRVSQMRLRCRDRSRSKFYHSKHYYLTDLGDYVQDEDAAAVATGFLRLLWFTRAAPVLIIVPKVEFLTHLEKESLVDKEFGEGEDAMLVPYTDKESKVAMLVPYKDNESKNAWFFLKPFTWKLWLTTFGFVVWMALVVWILEHRINEDFRGSAVHQVGTSLWFSFSTMVFAQGERVFSNLTRFVVIVWIYVVFILMQSYTASLNSFLVVQNSQPAVADVNQLLKSGERVGYQHGSFVYGMLKQMKFDDSRLISYQSPEECHALLSKGSTKGGIAAAFDEVPYIKLVLSRYCNKYTMISTSKTAGFDFVLPKASPLVPDNWRGNLNPSRTNCLDSNSSVSSNSLGLDSFWGLFLIAGAASVLALLIFTVMFVKRNWLEVTSSSGSLCEKIVALGRRFYQRDVISHDSRNDRFRGRSSDDGGSEIAAAETPENANPLPCPLSDASQNDDVLTDEQGAPSAEQGLHNHVEEGCPDVSMNIELTNVNQERDMPQEP